MLLVIDAGNTNIVFGLFEGDRLIEHFRMTTEPICTADQYGMFLLNAFAVFKRQPIIDGASIASVVVKATNPLSHAIQRYFNVAPIVVDTTLNIGLKNCYDNPFELGPDRIANAVAGYNFYKGAVLIIDFGTATTFSSVSSKGEFLGGAICPGMNVCLDALARKTSRLPGIDILKPKKAMGKNTIENISSGVFFGHLGMVEYLIKKLKKEMNEEKVTVVATGGLASLVADSTDFIDEIREHLTLEGLRIIYDICKLH